MLRKSCRLSGCVLALSLAFVGCGGGSPAGLPNDAGTNSSADAQPDAPAAAVASPVYFTVVIHNERTLTRFDRFRSSIQGYETYRAALLRIADLLVKYKVKLSYQSDYLLMDAVEKHEATVLAKDGSKTNGKKLYNYLVEDLGFSLEAHAHECILNTGNPSLCSDKQYNYADVVARIREVTGISPPAIIGGTSSSERPLSEWTSCIQGNVYKEKWCPEALTVFAGADGGHAVGSDDLHSGVWRPTSLTSTEFLVDNPSGKLAYIGSGYLFSALFGARNVVTEPVTGIQKLVSMVDAAAIAKGKIVTSSIVITVDKFIDEDYYDELDTLLGQLKPLLDSGKVVAATYPEVLANWRASYGSVPNIVTF